jgi:hypothetical protein
MFDRRTVLRAVSPGLAVVLAALALVSPLGAAGLGAIHGVPSAPAGEASMATLAGPGLPNGVRAADSPDLQWVDLENLSPLGSSDLVASSLAYDPPLGEAVLFGGSSVSPVGGAGASNATWVFADGAWSQVAANTTPPATVGSSEVYDAALGAVVLVDVSGSTYYPVASSWTYDAGGWTNVSEYGNVTAAPFGAMAYDPAISGVLRFGGLEPGGDTDSRVTEVLQGDAWTKLNLKLAPPAVSSAAAAYDPSLDGVVLFGGTTPSITSNQTWLFANSTWRPVETASSPPALAGATATWDPSLGGILLEGGTTAAGLYGPPVASADRAWLFRDGNWTAIPAPAAAPVTIVSAAVYVPSLGGILNVGGWGAPGNTSSELSTLGPVQENWLTSIAPAILPTVTPGPYEAGVAVNFSDRLGADAPNEWSYWSFGDGTTAAQAAATHVYDGPGTYTATYNASVPDAGARSYDEGNMTLTVAAGLLLAAVEPIQTTDPYHPVHLRADLSGGIAPIAVIWSFGDGTHASGATVQVHNFTGPGNFTVVARATDALGVVRTAEFRVQVEPFAQVDLALPATVLDLGQPLALSIETRNGSGPLSFAYDGLPDGCVSADERIFTCVPSATGIYEVVGSVTDVDGVVIESSPVIVRVYPPLAGVLAVSAGVLDLGSSFALTASMASDGSGNVSIGLPGGLGCVASSPMAAWCTPPTVGTFGVEATATDLAGGLLALSGGSVVIHPDLSLSIAGPTAPVPRAVPYYVSFAPSGGTPPYRYTVASVPTGCVALNATELRCYPALAGAFPLNVTAVDGVGASASAHLTVVVLGSPIVGGPAPGGGPPPASPLDDLWLWAVVAAALAEIVLSLRYSHRRQRRGRPRIRKGLWSDLGSAALDASDVEGRSDDLLESWASSIEDDASDLGS